MATRCKMVCSFKDEQYRQLHFSVVYGGSPENEQFFKFTPGGNMQFATVNDAAFDSFEQGKEYYIDITPATK